MTTAVFVHGTGVRRAHFDDLFARVVVGFAGAAPTLRVAPCYWGDDHGSRLRADGATIPSGTSNRGAPLDDEGDDDVAAWALLDRDPLFELRLAALRGDPDGWSGPPNAASWPGLPGTAGWTGSPGAAGGAGPPGAATPPEALAEALRDACRDEILARLLASAGLALDDFARAMDEVVESAPFEDAAYAAADPALAVRAVVARTLSLADARAGGPVPVTGEQRDEIVERGAALLGTARGIGADLARVGLRLAVSLGATRPVERRRLALTEAASPASGDVLRYLARGAGIRGAIAAAVAAAEPPVVLVAHSLGGVASVDLLASDPPPGVALLVTVGSQAPLLYELDALPTLPYGQPLPRRFPPWLNVYDPRDLLAFLAAPVFPTAIDHALDNRCPFPRSHSAYFGNTALYRRIAKALP